MELLILKTGDFYIRFKNDTYFKVAIDKASVFPLDQMEQVRWHQARLVEAGELAVKIKKLIITEKELDTCE